MSQAFPFDHFQVEAAHTRTRHLPHLNIREAKTGGLYHAASVQYSLPTPRRSDCRSGGGRRGVVHRTPRRRRLEGGVWGRCLEPRARLLVSLCWSVIRRLLVAHPRDGMFVAGVCFESGRDVAPVKVAHVNHAGASAEYGRFLRSRLRRQRSFRDETTDGRQGPMLLTR